MGATAGAGAGISRLSGKAGQVAGQLTETLSQGLGRMATTALAVSRSFEGPQRLEALTPLAAVGALVSGDSRTRLRWLNILTAAQVGKATSTALGTGLARLSRSQGEPGRTEVYFKGKPAVRSWPSRLTPAFNAADILGWPQREITFSGGQMVESGGKSWHVGTTVVKLPQGEQRAITHLRSLALPGCHYYFDRPLKERQVAGLILGQQGFEAKHLPGFVGQVSELESLQPGLAQLKHGLIRAQLLWGKR